MRLESKNGMPALNGIGISLSDRSHFGPGACAVMQFTRTDGDRLGDIPYQEVEALDCRTALEDFSAPPNASYEICRLGDGRIDVQVFAKEMPGSPVLHWVFPKSTHTSEELYVELCAGLDVKVTPSRG